MSKLEQLCGLVFSVNAVKKVLIGELKLLNVTYNISNEILIQLAAVIEYLVAEIYELGGNVTRDNRKTRVTIEHIIKAINNDDELKIVFNSSNNIQSNKPTDDTPKFKTWSYKVLKCVHPDTYVCADASRFMDKLIFDIIEKIAGEFPQDEKELNFPYIIEKVLSCELAKHAKSEANKSLVKYKSDLYNM
ncbi:MAG: hypothetical protein MUO21_07215 [Nitrososphaeraceae archaeon]|nr:hypothetical protein [Nitrososphaeraceae archaeon]